MLCCDVTSTCNLGSTHCFSLGDSGAAEGLQPDRKKRRRSGTVDYKALDEQLRAEHEAQGDKQADIRPE